MKKLFITLLLIAFMPFMTYAQDGRQRTPETIVADALAQLPAQTPQEFDSTMQELAGTGAKGICIMGGMLVPASDGKNAPVEYALNGVVSYVSAQGREALAKEVRKGLCTAVEACTDKPNQAFLLTLLRMCSTAEEAPVFVKYADDKYLADYAIRGLISTPGTEEPLLNLIAKSQQANAMLAESAAVKGLVQAEPTLLKWLAVPTTDTSTQKVICNALARCGTQASLAPLAAAARKANFAFDKTDATGAYLDLLKRLAANGDKKALAAAKQLCKTEMPQNVRIAGLEIVLKNNPKKQTQEMIAALKDANREYRGAALNLAIDFADEALYAAMTKKMASLNTTAQADIVSWLGTHHATSQSAAIVRAMGSDDDELAQAAIRAAGKIGGQEALNALIAQLGGKHSKQAAAALIAFNGNSTEAFIAALNSEPNTQIQALNLVSARKITSASEKVFELLQSNNAEVRKAAYAALAGVTAIADFDRLCKLLDAAPESDVAAIQAGLKKALNKETPDAQYKLVAGKMAQAKSQARYYPLLAQAANADAIAALRGAKESEAAFKALLTVENPVMIEVLFELAQQNAAWTDAAISRYTDFVTKSAATPVRKFQLYRQGLEINPSVQTQVKLLHAMNQTPIFPALVVASRYMENTATAAAAAQVVKTVVAKNPALGGEIVREALQKAGAIYTELAKTDPDAGYAVDEIKGLATKVPATGFVPVSLDPTGWNAVVGNPESRKSMKPRALAKAQKEATTQAAATWTYADGLLTAAAQAATLGSAKAYENFELLLEWKSEGQAGIGVRSIPQILLGGDNAGVQNGKKAETKAANRAGEWNTMLIRVVNDRVTVELNGVTTSRNEILENSCKPEQPAYTEGEILLVAGDQPVTFRNMYIQELPSTPRFELSKEEKAEGFEVLFDGTSMHKWTGNTTNYVPVDGAIFVTAQYGGSGNLYTKKEYANFVLRFEFAFVNNGVNNGIGIRTPMGVDAAYHGMEIQVLDHDDPIYKNLRIYQQHGSVYGIIPAKHVKFPQLGTWNVEEIRAEGDHITVTVNGEVIVDGNIREACQGHNVAPDGSNQNPYTVDQLNHPGLFNKSGHIGLLGHGPGIKFRNIRIKELPATK